jgi:hypothetical protein
MSPLQWDFHQQIKHNRDGSFATQTARSRTLDLAARELRELGYSNLRAQNLGQRHLKALVEKWRTEGRTAATMKNRMSHIRWSCEKAGRSGVAGITNDALGIERRTFVAKESKASAFERGQLDQVRDAHLRMSLRMQSAFGLRREECMKIRPQMAERDGKLCLQASWTKGGRAREILIRTDEQRQVLREAQQLAGAGSLIPASRSYVQQLRLYERQTAEAGISKAHGLRHHYAQQRYLELTGRQAPAVLASLAKMERAEMVGQSGHMTRLNFVTPTLPPGFQHAGMSDADARQVISRELGHERVAITTTYLGSESDR